MAINITIDNNRSTPAIDPLLADESAGVQTTASMDDGNEIDVTLTAGVIGGFDTAFNTFLNGLNLSAAQEEFARDHDGASSASNFVLVSTTANETVNDLFFSDAMGAALDGDQVVGMKTLDGKDVFLYTDGTFGSSGDFCVAVTHDINGDPDEIVAAFYLKESADHKSAQVQMVTFEPLLHPNAANPDDPLNFTDVMRVSASGSLSFDFDMLKSGSSLWVAVGNSSAGMLVTGGDPIVDGDGKKTNESDVIHTSQGGVDATIGVNNQLFDNVGETAVFTLVTGLDSLSGSDDGAASDYVVDHTGPTADGIDYSGYINVTGAGIFLSQSQGNDVKNFDIVVLETGGNPTPGPQTVEEGFNYIPGLTGDTAVPVATVTVTDDDGDIVGIWVAGADPDGAGPLLGSGASVNNSSANGTTTVQVTINGNIIDVNGALGEYTVSWTVASGETFNRFSLVAEGGQFDVGRVDITQTIPGGTAVGDQLFVEDDGPALSGQNVSKQVDEDELSSSSVAPADTSDGITDNDSDTDEVSYSNADLQAVVSAGTDTPASFALNLSVSGAVKDIDGNAMTSKGDAITWSVSSGAIQAVAGGRVVFTITQTAGAGTPNDPTDDVFTVDLRDQIDHPNASGDNGTETLDLTPAFSAKDADSDPVDLNGANNLATPIRLVVENDIPTLSGQNASVRVEEDELSSSAPAPADTSNGVTDNDGDDDEVSLTVTALQAVATSGADEPVDFALNLSVSGAVKDIDGNAMTSKGDAMTWSVSSGVVQAVAGGRVVFTVTHNDNGTPDDASDDSFDIDLRDQIDHPNASGDDGVETLDLTPAFTASDFDGDPVDLNGADNLQTPIRLVVENDIPILSGQNVSKRVEEDELSTSAPAPADTSNGITDNDADDDEVDYSNADLQAAVTSGADEPASFALNLSVSGAVKDIDGFAMTSKGDAITWSVSGGVISAVAGGRVVFTITQTAGAGTPNDPTDDVFTVDLRDQIDHDNASGDNGVETLDLTPAFTAEDFDGDPVDLNGADNLQTPIRLVVENDIPTLSGQNASVRVEEDELSSSAPAPADTSDGITDSDLDDDEASLTVAALQAVATPGADEPVEFELNLAVSGAVKDIDGNSMTSKGDAITWSVSGGVVSAVAGGRVVFTVTHNDNGTPDDASDDSFDIDLRDQIDHPNASGDGGIETIDLTPAFTAKDFDGDPVDLNGADNLQTPIRLVVENDVPALSGATASARVEEDELSTSAPAPADTSNGITDNDSDDDEVDFTYAMLDDVVTNGADEPASFALNLSVSGAVKDVDGTAMTSKGDAITWSVSGGVVSAVAGGRVIFTITQTAGAGTANPTDDVFSVDLRDQIDHPNASGDTGIETLDLTPAFTAKDFDGDALDLNGANDDQEPIQLVVENDVPAITAQILGGAVDFVLSDSVTNSLNGAIGADDNSATQTTSSGGKQYVITSFSEPKNVFPDLDGVLSADGTKVTYYSTSVTANQNASTAVYELSLNQTANNGAGSYTFTVLQPPPISVQEFDFTDLPSGQNLHGTIANDKTNINNNGTPNNAADDFLPDGGLLVFPSNPDIDGDGMLTNTSGTVNTSKGGGPVTIGNANQAFDSTDEGAFFCYVDNPLVSAVGGLGLTQTSADDADLIGFDGTIETTKASVEIVQASGAGTAKRPGPDLQITAYDIDPGKVGGSSPDVAARDFLMDPTATDAQANIIGVKIIDAATGKVIEYVKDVGAIDGVYELQDSDDTGTDVGASDNSLVDIQFVQDATGIHSVVVSNLKANYTIEFETEEAHDMAKVQHVDGSYDIGGFNILQGQDTPDQMFNFSVGIRDFDGDADGGLLDPFANFGVTVDGTGAFNDPLLG